MTNSPSQAPRIFMSHSSKDNYFGFKLVEDLRRVLGDDSAVWYDSAGGLFGGDSWFDKIEEELMARESFIIVLSPDAMNSKWVRREFTIALNEGKRIVPVRCREGDVWPYLRILQIISFVDAQYYETSFTELLQALGITRGGKPNYAPKTPATIILQQMTPQIEKAFKVHDWSGVIDQVGDVINKTLGVSTSAIYHMQGVAFFKEGKLQEAGVALRAARSLVSSSEQSLAVMQDYAAVLNAQTQWAELLNVAEEALQLAPHNPDWWRAVQKKAGEGLRNGQKQFGDYRVIKSLGQETLDNKVLSEIYLGEHIVHKNPVMIKPLNVSLKGNDRMRFRSEVGIIARLTHPNIACIIDFGVEEDTPFLVMNVISGESLRQHYSLGIKLPLHTIKSYIKQIAAALQYAHDQNIFHGNIMPENMLVGAKQEILLSDFYIEIIAQRLGRQSNSIYLAPEQLAGQQNPACDQYALAVVVYEWLTGNQPTRSDLTFMDGSMQDYSIFPSSLRERVPNISSAVERALMRALNHNPRGRFEKIEDFANALENAP